MSTMSSSTTVPDPMDIDSPRPVSSDSSLYGSSPTRTSLLTRLANSPPCSNSYFSNHLPASQILPSRPNHPLMQNHNSPQVALQIPNSDTNTITPPYANAYNPYLSSPSAYQFTTPLSTFLSTYPPSTTPSSAIGSSPFLYISNPYRSAANRPLAQDWAGFTTAGKSLLEEYGAEISKIDVLPFENRKRGTVMWKRGEELRKGLKEGILKEARERGCLSGKWMLFPNVDDVDAIWAKVAQGTVEGGLGIAAKVAVDSSEIRGEEERGGGKGRLICVYTYDAEDKEDVRRVLRGLEEVGVLPQEEGGKGIYYKCDAFTHLGIAGGNQWGLRASLYGSLDGDMRV